MIGDRPRPCRRPHPADKRAEHGKRAIGDRPYGVGGGYSLGQGIWWRPYGVGGGYLPGSDVYRRLGQGHIRANVPASVLLRRGAAWCARTFFQHAIPHRAYRPTLHLRTRFILRRLPGGRSMPRSYGVGGGYFPGSDVYRRLGQGYVRANAFASDPQQL